MRNLGYFKIMSVLLIMMLCIGLVGGCGNSEAVSDENQKTMASEEQQPIKTEEKTDISDDTDFQKYKEILDYYYDQASNGWPEEGLYKEKEIEASYMYFRYFPNLSDVGYTLIDLDKDGVQELIMGTFNNDYKDEIMDLFTIVNGKVKHVFSGGERDGFYLLSDCTLVNQGSSGAADSVVAHFSLKNGRLWALDYIHMTDIFTGEYTVYHGKDFYEDEYVRKAYSEQGPSYAKSLLETISWERAEDIISAWPPLKTLEMTPLSTYRKGDNSSEKNKKQTIKYEVFKADVSWTRANDLAVSKGGELVSIHNAEEFSKVCAEADSKGLKVFWVGAWRSMEETWDEVGWLDGTPLSGFTKWYQGEPSYTEGDSDLEECYLMVFKVNGNWYFNDAIDDVISVAPNYKGKMGYVVEYK